MTEAGLEQSLLIKFREDIEQISTVLIQAFDLRFKRDIPNLSSAVTRWLDFRMRYVAPTPRVVAYSDRFPKHLPKPARRGLKQLVHRLQLGQDVNPYQGRGLKLRNDTSGSRLGNRTDFLFADWGILHFHLSEKPIPSGQYFSAAADWLAFCIVRPDEVGVVDVVRHPDVSGFGDPELLETALRSWPDYAQMYRAKGITGETLTRDKVNQLRSMAANTIFAYRGHSYMAPGGGLMSAGIPASVCRMEMMLEHSLSYLSQIILEPDSQFLNHPEVIKGGAPDFSLKVHDGGIGVYERTSQVLFQHPRDDVAPSQGSLGWVSETLLPKWAMQQVIAAKESFDHLFCEPPQAPIVAQ